MNLAQKAWVLLIANVVITFSLGIFARNEFVNPRLAKVEQHNDQRLVQQLDNVLASIAGQQAAEIQQLQALYLASSVNQPQSDWPHVSSAFEQLVQVQPMDYVLAASRDGSLSLVRSRQPPAASRSSDNLPYRKSSMCSAKSKPIFRPFHSTGFIPVLSRRGMDRS